MAGPAADLVPVENDPIRTFRTGSIGSALVYLTSRHTCILPPGDERARKH